MAAVGFAVAFSVGVAVAVSVAAGEVVIREGEVGDRFYIVDHGQLEVVGPGVRATAGAGDYFGEIALIRDVPRTATVTAVADSRLYAMERSDFVAAVTSHSGVRAAGEEVVHQRHGNAKRVGESA